MDLSGVLNLGKKHGPTSRDMVDEVRRLLPKKTKVGHAGTLDPMAEGVLPICIGHATKLFSYLLECRKKYRAVMLFGRVTDTQDITGKLLAESEPGDITLPRAQELLNAMLGKTTQVPPMYSALKVDGKRLHELARSGKEIERTGRPIEVFRIEAIKMEGPQLTFDVACSRGTYIRAICHDVGAAQGAGGCLQALTRTALGPFDLGDSVSIEDARRHAKEGRLEEILVSPAQALAHLPAVYVSSKEEARVLNGATVRLADVRQSVDLPPDARVRMLSEPGKLLAVGKMVYEKKQKRSRGIVAPEKVFAFQAG